MSADIRRATGSEAATLTAIAFAAKRYWGYPEDLLRLWSSDLTVDNTYIETHEVYAAVRDTRIVGWCAAVTKPDRIWIEHCWVLPDAAGQGIGRLLVREVFALAAELNRPTIAVISDPNAEGFYARLGFRRVGHQPSVPAGRQLPVLEALRPAEGPASA